MCNKINYYYSTKHTSALSHLHLNQKFNIEFSKLVVEIMNDVTSIPNFHQFVKPRTNEECAINR